MLISLHKSSIYAICFGLVWAAIGSAATAQGQLGLFSSPPLERRLKREFKLTNNDLKRLRPLIGRENESVIRTYGRYADERYRENFLSLWDGIRANRWEFEASLPSDLSERQKSALRMARTEFETKILDLWLEDYLDLLADALELDRLQLSCLQTMLENETDLRLRMMINETKKGTRMDSEWQRPSDEREENIKKILNADQLRIYLSLDKPAEGLVA